MKLDIIIPTFNEESNILPLYNELTKALKGIKHRLIFVDDGSKDNTYKELTNIYNKDKEHIIVKRFSRNFGKDAAIYAGLEEVSADYVCIIDADLQQDPNLIIDMLKKIESTEDTDVICMVNDYSNEHFISKVCKKAFYFIMNRICDQNKYKPGASDFRLFTNKVCQALLSLDEKNRFSKGLFSWIGFNTLYLPYKANKRLTGKSKFRLKKQFSYAIDGIVNFSTKPLRIATILGTIISTISFILLIIMVIQTLCNIKEIQTTAAIICILLLLGGIILLVLGIIGEYIAKLYIEAKHRPIYIEKEKLQKK